MPPGRPRLPPDQYEARLEAYCAQYGVVRAPGEFPPFPTGQRETAQHREWMKLYKARRRQTTPRRASASAEERHALLEAQDGRCPICAEPVDGGDALDAGDRARGRGPAILHRRCQQLSSAAQELGPGGLDRLRHYLWPTKHRGRGSRTS